MCYVSLRRLTDAAVFFFLLNLALLGPGCCAASTRLKTSTGGPYSYDLTQAAVIPVPSFGQLRHNNHSYFVLEDAYLVAYPLETPGNASWELVLNTSLCAPAEGVASSGSSGLSPQSYGSEWKELSSVDDERLLVYCGANLVLVNATNGSVIATHRFANGGIIGQHASTSASTVMVELTPSGRVVSFDLHTLRERWWLSGDSNDVPLLGGGNGVAVVVDLFNDFTGAVQGFDAFSGRLLWNVSMQMWGKALVVSFPMFSDSIFAWYGPDFASVRTVYIPTGAYWQYIAPFRIQLIRPTNDGRLLVASVSTIIAISVVSRTVLWERTVPIPVLAMPVSADEGYLMVEADSFAELPTLVLSMADGSLVGDCGNVHCSYSCVLGMPSMHVVLLLNCSVGNETTLRAVDPATKEVLSSPLPIPDATHFARAQLESLSSDLVAVTGPSVRIVRVLPADTSTKAPLASTQQLDVGGREPAIAIGVMVALCVVGAATTLYCRCQRRSSLPPTTTTVAEVSIQEAMVAEDSHDDALRLRAAFTV